MKNFDDLLIKVKTKEKKTIAVAACEERHILEAIIEASKLDLANFSLFGNLERTNTILKENNLKLPNNVTIFNNANENESVEKAVKYVSNENADCLMKGLVDTKIILKEVLNKEYGLRTNSILSHVVVFDIPKFKRLLFLTDAAMIISPKKDDLIAIINNAVYLAKKLDIQMPKVALISAVEKVNEKMPSTILENEIVNELKGKVDFLIDGPMALDIALSTEAAITKGYTGTIKGDADILVVPYIEAGNILYKGWMLGIDNLKNAGIIVGAKKPIILTSRADSMQAKLYSMILALSM